MSLYCNKLSVFFEARLAEVGSSQLLHIPKRLDLLDRANLRFGAANWTSAAKLEPQRS